MEYKFNDFGLICNPVKRNPAKFYLIFCHQITDFKDDRFYEFDRLVIFNRVMVRELLDGR